MIAIGTTIEANGFDSGSDGAFGNCLADRLGRVGVAAALELLRKRFVLRRSSCQGLAGLVVDDLDRNVFVTADDAQPRTLFRAAHTLANAKRAPLTELSKLFGMFHGWER